MPSQPFTTLPARSAWRARHERPAALHQAARWRLRWCWRFASLGWTQARRLDGSRWRVGLYIIPVPLVRRPRSATGPGQRRSSDHALREVRPGVEALKMASGMRQTTALRLAPARKAPLKQPRSLRVPERQLCIAISDTMRPVRSSGCSKQRGIPLAGTSVPRSEIPLGSCLPEVYPRTAICAAAADIGGKDGRSSLCQPTPT